MNYIELINWFWELDEVWQFNCCETRLYFYLVKVANRLGWLNSWTHSDARTSANVGVSLNVMKNARNKLIQSGLIAVKAGGKGFGDKTRYQIMTPTSSPKPQPTSSPTYEPNHDPLNKQKHKRKHKEDTEEFRLSFGDESSDPEKGFQNEVMDYFNANCKGLTKVKVLTDKRKRAVFARYREHGREAIFEMMRKASASKFLNGQGKHSFVATFDWLFRPENFIKTLEGNYDERNGQQQKTVTIDQGKQDLLDRIKQEAAGVGSIPGC